jgi:hypothetical protein
MLTELFNTDSCIIKLDKKQQNIQITWLSQSANMDTQDFKDAVSNLTLMIEAYKPTSLLINAEKFDFTIEPDLQEWYKENIITKYLQSHLKHIGVIKPQDFITGLSMEQMFGSVKSSNTITLHFLNDITEADNWVNSQALLA